MYNNGSYRCLFGLLADNNLIQCWQNIQKDSHDYFGGSSPSLRDARQHKVNDSNVLFLLFQWITCMCSVTLQMMHVNSVRLFVHQRRTRAAGPSGGPAAASPVQTFRRTIRAAANVRGPSSPIQETPSRWSSPNSRWTANSTLWKSRDLIHQQYGENHPGLSLEWLPDDQWWHFLHIWFHLSCVTPQPFFSWEFKKKKKLVWLHDHLFIGLTQKNPSFW